MLKRLELIGFKSFADRTRFDFAPGITAIVGPNGSGKSNIVDAVKWILGEQSSKSLRAGEMADVIFNGSSSRKSLGMAEVTMTFDNTRRVLGFDADEVQITRRVYRDGQGEYCINGSEARLKDIKDLFLGSGAGHGAYSIIEQGRVDALLLASTKDRRLIFEEAAGISRFRVKKLEALRKLERVDADLNRVRDLLQELENTLRTLQTQAAKAQKYQEYQARLKELRITIGRHEFLELQETLAYQEHVLATLRAAVAETTVQTHQSEATQRELEATLARLDEQLRQGERELSAGRTRIAEFEAQARSAREQATASTAELLRLGQQRATLTQRALTMAADIAQVQGTIGESQASVAREQASTDAAAAALQVVVQTIHSLTKQSQADRGELLATVDRAAKSHTTAEVSRRQMERLQQELHAKASEYQRASQGASAIAQVLGELAQTDADVQQRLQSARDLLHESQQEQADLRKQAETIQPELDELRAKRNASQGRIEVLQGLEASLEGIGAGVRAMLAGELANNLVGLVADSLRTSREFAPLVDIALGDSAQRFVVRDPARLDHILAALPPLPGRVGFMPRLQNRLPLPPAPVGVIRLADVVQADDPNLVEQLLGSVWLVESREQARALQQSFPAVRYLTSQGELFEPDGTVVIGPPHAESGIVSRKSELRELREELARLDRRIQERERDQSQLRERADQLDEPMSRALAEIATLTGEAGTLRDRIVEQRQRQERLLELAELAEKESRLLTAELQKAEAAWREAATVAQEADQTAAALQARLAEADEQIQLATASRDQRQADLTRAQVALSRERQILASRESRFRELQAEWNQLTGDITRLTANEQTIRQRIQRLELAALHATMQAATQYRIKETVEQTYAEQSRQRKTVQAQREQLIHELAQYRESWQQRQDQAHAHELTVRDLQNRRDAIAARIREDYQVDLAALVSGESLGGGLVGEGPNRPGSEGDPTPSGDSARGDSAGRDSAGRDSAGGASTRVSRASVDSPVDDLHDEVEKLKRKIAQLGSVNLEALEQLAREEAREAAIRKEYDDLKAAEKSLLEIIEKINTDSRQLLSDTIAAVRVQFQELFRKLFGGGMAEILFEDPNDVLESGIEITARPPGKELRSIALMSGGEKTLTAIALLLAIFRSKPSPFCLLDEVDAALDEANTARLADVIQEFRDQSQFIIVTHKKRTMAIADVLHGVTMQESGISKQVATRLDDWPDEPSQQAA